MTFPALKLSGLAALLVLGVSCAGNQGAAPSSTPAATPADSSAPSADAAPSGPIDWASMNKLARTKYMKEVVMPKMKEVFVAFDPKYADMKCTTCHGSAAMDGSFTMPNPELPPLPADMSKFKEWAAQKPAITEFMVKQVKPEMAKLLNEPEYDPATHQGFGCGECHTMK